MQVALTGASGFLGVNIARKLVEAGHSVVGLVRESSRRDHVRSHIERFVYGDQSDESVFRELAEGSDWIIHNSVDWAPLKDGYKQKGGLRSHYQKNLVPSLRLLELTNPIPFTFVSSIAVHHDMRPSWDSAWKGDIDEDHPLRPSSPYGAYKAAIEAHLWCEHFRRERHTTAIRPCAVYGLDPKLHRCHGYDMIMQLLADRRYKKLGGGKFVHVDDVAAAVVALVGNKKAAGRAFNLVDCYARWADWAQMAAELLKIRPEIDDSSPVAPKNTFSKAAAQTLGVELDRGPEGIRAYLVDLIAELDRNKLLER